MKEIIAACGTVIQVSDKDFDYLNQFKWHMTGRKRTLYAAKHKPNTRKDYIFMHHVILDLMGVVIPEGMETDHKDRNTTNNQRENLRVVTKSINMHNRGIYNNNTSGVKGVNWHKRINRWTAYYSKNKCRIHLGSFLTFEEAVAARRKAEEKYG